jgi:predicted Zn-dependent protease
MQRRTIARAPTALAIAALFSACGGRQTTTRPVRAEDIVISDPEIPEGAYQEGGRSTEEIRATLRPRMERKELGALPKPKLEDFSDEDERVVGEATARSILARYPLVPVDTPLSKYVRTVGAILAESSSRRDIQFRFAIVESTAPNAFAAPFGYIFVTTALLDLVETEAELAFVLAHEIGHVEMRHGLEQVIEGWYEQEKRSFGAEATELTAGSRSRSTADVFEDLSAYSHRLSDMVIQAKGRDQETESDARGLELMTRVGYSARGALDFIARLAKVHGSRSEAADIFRSHPHLEERQALAVAALGRYGTDGAVLAERYRAMVGASR